MIVGDLVKLEKPCLGNNKETIGVIYETYDIGFGSGVSIIFENGNYDGFSEEDGEIFLRYYGHEPSIADYKFTNVMKLSQDFNKGRFNLAFKC